MCSYLTCTSLVTSFKEFALHVARTNAVLSEVPLCFLNSC